MGMEQQRHGAWDRIKEIADSLESPHADKVYVAKDYTKADLRRDLLATIPSAPVCSEPADQFAAGWTAACKHLDAQRARDSTPDWRGPPIPGWAP